MKNLCFTIAFVAVGAQLQHAKADGALPSAASGQLGVNRRVLTQDLGYTGVKGYFTLPTVSVPQNSLYNSKPTFYLGCTQTRLSDYEDITPLQVDAGFQWEPNIMSFTENNVTRYLPPSWSVFLRSTDARNAPKGTQINPSGGWRCGPGTANSGVTNVELRWILFRRTTSPVPSVGPKFGGYLYVNAFGATAQPSGAAGPGKLVARIGSGPDAEGLTDDLTGMQGKRVVGVTQNSFGSFPRPTGGVWDEDGTVVTNLNFSDGQVTQASPLGGPFGYNYSPGGWTVWNDIHTDLNDTPSPSNRSPSGTGFYPGGRDLTLRRMKLYPNYGEDILDWSTTGAKDIFQFPGLTDREAPVPARYSFEKVNINLRHFTVITGSFVGSGG